MLERPKICFLDALASLRGAPQKVPLTNLGFCPNRLDPPPHPLPRGWDTDNKKNFFWCLFCILGYSKHFIFSWKFSFFGLGLGYIGVYWAHELMRYHPPIYVLCVSSHFWPFTKVNFVFANFTNKLGLCQTPTPPSQCLKRGSFSSNLNCFQNVFF